MATIMMDIQVFFLLFNWFMFGIVIQVCYVTDCKYYIKLKVQEENSILKMEQLFQRWKILFGVIFVVLRRIFFLSAITTLALTTSALVLQPFLHPQNTKVAQSLGIALHCISLGRNAYLPFPIQNLPLVVNSVWVILLYVQ